MKLHSMQTSPVTYHILPLRFTYSPLHPVFKYPQSVSSFSMTDQILQPFRTTGKLVYFLLYFNP